MWASGGVSAVIECPPPPKKKKIIAASINKEKKRKEKHVSKTFIFSFNTTLRMQTLLIDPCRLRHLEIPRSSRDMFKSSQYWFNFKLYRKKWFKNIIEESQIKYDPYSVHRKERFCLLFSGCARNRNIKLRAPCTEAKWRYMSLKESNDFVESPIKSSNEAQLFEFPATCQMSEGCQGG